MIIATIAETQAVIQAVKAIGLANIDEIETELALTDSEDLKRFHGPNVYSVLKACLAHAFNQGILKKSVGPNGMECWCTSGYPLPDHMTQMV